MAKNTGKPPSKESEATKHMKEALRRIREKSANASDKDLVVKDAKSAMQAPPKGRSIRHQGR